MGRSSRVSQYIYVRVLGWIDWASYGLWRLWAAIGDPARNGDGEVGNVPTSASPDGATFSPLTFPWGTNLPYFLPLMEEIPIGDRDRN